MTKRRPRIGITANFLHNDPARPLFRSKALHFVEERMATSVWRCGGTPWLIPQLFRAEDTRELAAEMDGLLLSGGADVSPRSYGEAPVEDKWQGDYIRDGYEIDLLRQAMERGIPVLGICRGLQLINVALGGTLWQDIETQRGESLAHRDWERYDELGHTVELAAGSWIAERYLGHTQIGVNSVHHQAVRELAPDLRATAHAPDGIVEAVEMMQGRSWVNAVQWHPEWLEPERVGQPGDAAEAWSEGDPIMRAFVQACEERSLVREGGSAVRTRSTQPVS